MVVSEGYLGCSKKAHTVPRSNGKIGKGKFWLNSQKKLLAGPPVLWSHLSRGRMDALLNCWSGLGFTLTGVLLCLPSCSAVLWLWTKTVKSPEEGPVWSRTQLLGNGWVQMITIREWGKGYTSPNTRHLRPTGLGDGDQTSHYHLKWMQTQEGKCTLCSILMLDEDLRNPLMTLT